MCLSCVYGGEGIDNSRLPETSTTFQFPPFMLEFAQHHIDWEAVEYLPKEVRKYFPKAILPLKTTGDGNCLLNAVSRAVFGVEVFWDLLRALVISELNDNIEWYKSCKEFEQSEWDSAVQEAQKSGFYLNFMHIFALSNVIKRPIILYASDDDTSRYGTGESGVAATFVPTRHPPEQCTPTPIYLVWGSSKKNHYVPLIGLAGHGQHPPQLPLFFPAAFPSLMPDGRDTKAYLNQGVALKDPEILQLLQQTHEQDKKQEEEEAAHAESAAEALRQAFLAAELRRAAQSVDNSQYFRKRSLRDSAEDENATETEYFTTEDGHMYIIERPKNSEIRIENGRMFLVKKNVDEKSKAITNTQVKKTSDEELEEYYDHLFKVQLPDGTILVIGHRKGDSILETTERFIRENEMAAPFRDKIITLLTNRIPLGHTQMPQTSVFPKLEKFFYSRLVNNPTAETFNNVFNKIVEFSKKEAKGLTDEEVQSLRKIIDTLFNNPWALSTAEMVTWQKKQLQIFNKMIGWKTEHLFPVLDILRLVVLYPRAAEYLSTENTILDRIWELMVSSDNRIIQMMILKFIVNMFNFYVFEEVALKFISKIIPAIAQRHADSTDKVISGCLAAILLNYSIVLFDKYDPTRKPYLGALLADLTIKYFSTQTYDTPVMLLTALGNLLWKDKSTRERLQVPLIRLVASFVHIHLIKELVNHDETLLAVINDFQAILSES